MERIINSLFGMTHWVLLAMVVAPILLGSLTFLLQKKEKLRTVLIWLASAVVLVGGILLVWLSAGNEENVVKVWQWKVSSSFGMIGFGLEAFKIITAELSVSAACGGGAEAEIKNFLAHENKLLAVGNLSDFRRTHFRTDFGRKACGQPQQRRALRYIADNASQSDSTRNGLSADDGFDVKDIKKDDYDSIVLACTHYPYIKIPDKAVVEYLKNGAGCNHGS